jgi:lipopolysaccharide/colanic/teichoic acid biosynthesis glycosyltransferase
MVFDRLLREIQVAMYPDGASFQDAYRKLQFDIYYIYNASRFFDLKIAWRTANVVLFCDGSR